MLIGGDDQHQLASCCFTTYHRFLVCRRVFSRLGGANVRNFANAARILGWIDIIERVPDTVCLGTAGVKGNLSATCNRSRNCSDVATFRLSALLQKSYWIDTLRSRDTSHTPEVSNEVTLFVGALVRSVRMALARWGGVGMANLPRNELGDIVLGESLWPHREEAEWALNGHSVIDRMRRERLTSNPNYHPTPVLFNKPASSQTSILQKAADAEFEDDFI